MSGLLLLRRAVLHSLIAAFPGSLTIAEITLRIRTTRPLDDVVGPLTPKRLSDLLRFQMGRGSVRRVETGRYLWVPGSLGRTTLWRYRNWPRQFDELVELIAAHGPPRGLEDGSARSRALQTPGRTA